MAKERDAPECSSGCVGVTELLANVKLLFPEQFIYCFNQHLNKQWTEIKEAEVTTTLIPFAGFHLSASFFDKKMFDSRYMCF